MSDPISPPEFERPIEVFVVHPAGHPYWLHGLLLLATIFTTLVVGARMQFNFLHDLPVMYTGDDGLNIFPVLWALQSNHLALGIPFSFSLMLILLAHEMGHYMYCRRYHVWATLPFFIPFPLGLIGTLGAFIRIRAPIRSRAALFDIGIAGPIAGFVVAVVVLFFSLGLSRAARPGPELPEIALGYPLIVDLVHLFWMAVSPAHSAAALPLYSVHLHPTAVAGCFGMFATALNLLPGGQLDGGHIVFALAPRAHRFVSRATILVLLPLAVWGWLGWLLWSILLGLSGMRHPAVPEWPSAGRGRRRLGLVALAMLILTWTPIPVRNSSLMQVVQQYRGQR